MKNSTRPSWLLIKKTLMQRVFYCFLFFGAFLFSGNQLYAQETQCDGSPDPGIFGPESIYAQLYYSNNSQTCVFIDCDEGADTAGGEIDASQLSVPNFDPDGPGHNCYENLEAANSDPINVQWIKFAQEAGYNGLIFDLTNGAALGWVIYYTTDPTQNNIGSMSFLACSDDNNSDIGCAEEMVNYPGGFQCFVNPVGTENDVYYFIGVYYTQTNGTIPFKTKECLQIDFCVNPQLSITDPTPVCSPSTVDITGAASGCGSGSSLSYWEDSNATVPLNNPSAIAVSGTYYIKCTDDYDSECFDIEQVTVTINQLPSAPSTTGDNNCGPGTVNLSASGCTGGTLTWYDAAVDGNVVTTGTTYSPNLTQTTTYYVSCTNSDGCEGPRASVVGTIYDVPIVSLNSVDDLCLQAEPIQLSGNPSGGVFTGAGVSSTGLFDANSAGVGSHMITYSYTDGNGCSSSDMITIDVYDCCSDETAFAYNTQCTGVDNLCFLDYEDELNENRWGWTLSGIDLESDISDDLGIQYNSYTVDLYAGNGNDCMPTDGPGQFVGTATITRNGDDITVSYNLIDDTEDTYYALYGLHVNIGCYQFALKPKGKKKMVNTVAPGQYNASGSGNGTSEGVVTIDVDDTVKDGNQYCLDNLYVIVHAEVEICTTEPMTSTPTAVRLVETAKVEPIQNETVAVDFKAYPVPFKDIVNISYRFDFDTKVTLEIIDLSGRLVYTKNIQNYVKGTNGMETIDLTKTNSQMLFVRLITDQGIKIKKIVAKQ